MNISIWKSTGCYPLPALRIEKRIFHQGKKISLHLTITGFFLHKIKSIRFINRKTIQNGQRKSKQKSRKY